MKYTTSGELRYGDAKGLHYCAASWWIDTGILDSAFRLVPYGSGAEVTQMDHRGRLTVAPGYLWDGSSGPTIDGEADPVPSLVHDVLYEAMRARKLPTSMRQVADALYYDLLRERGMGRFRAGL